MGSVQSQQPPARKVETLAPARAQFEPHHVIPRDPFVAIAGAQSLYYLVTGLWPILHLRSFAKVTGPKPEGWEVKGVGACIANVGWTLGRAALDGDSRNRRTTVNRDVRSLGLRFALTFAALDFFYAGVKRRISPVYLLNGIAQLGFAGAWIAAGALRRRERSSPPRSAAHA